MEFDFPAMTAADRYKLMTASITPRPIAWVTSVSAGGVRNAAPYSFFNMMGADPPLIALGMMRRPDGSRKDSTDNILATGEFVVNLVTEADAVAMNRTCIDAPPDFDELAMAEIETAASSLVAAPRIASAPVAMECGLHEAIETGSTTIVIGLVTRLHIADAYIDPKNLHIDTPAMKLVARLHGAGWYACVRDMFQLERPSFLGGADKPVGAARAK